MLFVTLN